MTAERTPHADDSLLAAPLLAITEFGLRRPSTVLVAACGLAVLAVALTVNGLTFKTSRLDLLNPRSEYNQRWLAYLAEFGNRDDACLVVRAERPADLTAAIDDLAAQLRAEGTLFDSVFHRRDFSALKTKALHYLPPEQLKQLEQQVAAAAALLPRPGATIDPTSELARLNEELAHVAMATPEQRARIDDRYAKIAGQLLAGLSQQSPHDVQAAASKSLPALPSLGALAHFEPQYLLADEGRIGFVLTRLNNQPADSSPASTAIGRLREIVKQTQTRHGQAWIGLTGMPVIEYDEMTASQFDMVWTSVASMALVLLLYLAAYGGLRHAALVNVLLLLGTAYSFGFVTIVVGHLNILSAAFSAVLIGLGIDFAIHYVATYLNLRRQGCDIETALLRMAVEVGPGVVTGGVTTAAAFFMAAMTDFVGVRELGLVAGGGILLCVLTTVVVLPALILLVDRRWPLRSLPTILPASRWFQFPLNWPRLTMAMSLLVVAVMALGGTRLRYDHNLLNLQPRHLESADIERQLFTRLDDSVWFGVSICRSPAELHERKAAFEKLPTVAKTEEIASLIPDQPPGHAVRMQALCRQLETIARARPASVTLDVSRLLPEIARAQEMLSKETPFDTAGSALLAQARVALASVSPDQAAAQLAQMQAALVRRITEPLAPLLPLADPAPPRASDVPRELADRYMGKSHTHLLKVYARGNVWNMEQLERFVHELESVDARVTGHPVQTYYASRHMQASYLWAGLYALGAILVLLWIDFQSLAHSLLATVPLAVGFVAMCGCLGWLDVPFNPANMIVLPLILGIGVDHGVHLVHLWRQQPGRFKLGDATTVAVILTASTTTASFGALILARHQGLQSLGQALTLGVTTCLAASIVFFPALLAWLTRNRAEKPETVSAETSFPGSAWERTSARLLPGAPVAQSAPQPVPIIEPEPELEPADVADDTRGGSLAVAGSQAEPGNQSVGAEPLDQDVEVAAGNPRADEWPATLPIAEHAPVSDDEIAALLETALAARAPARLVQTSEEALLDADNAAHVPRRRNLPRRSEAA